MTHSLSFPSFEKVADTFDFKYLHCSNGSEIEKCLKEFFESSDQVLLEVEQRFTDPPSPRLMSKMGPDGKFTTPSLIDMSPALPDDIQAKLKEYKYW